MTEATPPPGPSPAQLRGNVRSVLLLSGVWMFLLIMPVIVPFLQARGLTMTEVFALQTVFAVAIVVLEVPSGYVADLVGRRRCLIAASLLYGVAFTWLALGDGFWHFAVFELIAALATSLRSGTDVALLYDSLEALGDAGTGTKLLGRKLFWGQTGETTAALVGGGLAFASLDLPAQANAATAWIPLLVSLTLVEPPRRKLEGTHGENVREIASALLGGPRILRLTFLNLMAYGLATLMAVWAFQGYWGALNLPLGVFGLLWAAYNLCVAVTARQAHRIRRRFGRRRVVLAIGALPVVGYLGMAGCAAGDSGAGAALVAGGVLFGFAFQVSRGLTQVVIRDELNVRVSGAMRATANSLASLGVRLAFAALGPLLGWLIDRHGYGPPFAGFGVGFAVWAVALAVPLALALGREEQAEPVPAEG